MSEPERTTFEFAEFAISSTEFDDTAYRTALGGPTIVNPSSDNGRTVWAAPDVLTRREREVAVLAARGLSNREIANVFVVSVRTVENQLSRAYAKLALGGREELAFALGLRPAKDGDRLGRTVTLNGTPGPGDEIPHRI